RRQGEPTAIYLASLDSTEKRRLVNSDSQPAYAPPGFLLFTQGGTLLAQRFDARALRLHGETVPLADELAIEAGESGWYHFWPSATGALAFRRQARVQVRLTWFDRGGRVVGTVGGPGHYAMPDLSPDGHRLVVVSREGSAREAGIAIVDLERGTTHQLTPERGPFFGPLWCRDGRSIVFGFGAPGEPSELRRRSADGAGSDEVWFTSDGYLTPQGFSPDGRVLAYVSTPAGWGFASLRMGSPPDLKSSSDLGRRGAHQASFSPDGRWIAYASVESDRAEIAVEPFP